MPSLRRGPLCLYAEPERRNYVPIKPERRKHRKHRKAWAFLKPKTKSKGLSISSNILISVQTNYLASSLGCIAKSYGNGKGRGHVLEVFMTVLFLGRPAP